MDGSCGFFPLGSESYPLFVVTCATFQRTEQKHHRPPKRWRKEKKSFIPQKTKKT